MKKLDYDRFLAIFDEIAGKKEFQACSDEEEVFVTRLTQKLSDMKAVLTREYEQKKEALIQSFSQEFAMTQHRQQNPGEDDLKQSLADFLRSGSSGHSATMRVQQPAALQLHKIPSLTDMVRTERPEPQSSSRSQVSAAPEDVSALQQLLNKCEVELEAKNHMVTARDAQIEEFKATIKQLQSQAS